MSFADFWFEFEDLFFDVELADFEPEDFVLAEPPVPPAAFTPAPTAPVTAPPTAPLAAPLIISDKVSVAALTKPVTELAVFFPPPLLFWLELLLFLAGAAFFAGADFFAGDDFEVDLEAEPVVLLVPDFEAEPDDFAVEDLAPDPDDFAAVVFAPDDFAAEVFAAEPGDFAVEPDDFAAVVFAPDLAELVEDDVDDLPVEDDFAAEVFEPEDLPAVDAFVGAAFFGVIDFVFVFLVGIRFSPKSGYF